jgi:hypothetical protein
MTPSMPGLEIDFSAQVAASIGGLTEELRADRLRRQNLAADVAYLETPPISFTALPYAAVGWGPNTGFNWAVQRVTMSGFGATTDYVNMYRGTITAQAVGENGLYTFQVPVVGGLSEWKPGSKGLILKGDESLVFGGTITGGGTFFANVDVIQLTDAQLPSFLI